MEKRRIRAPKGEPRWAKFIIEPHFRLQEWVAEEKGYFGPKASTTNSAN